MKYCYLFEARRSEFDSVSFLNTITVSHTNVIPANHCRHKEQIFAAEKLKISTFLQGKALALYELDLPNIAKLPRRALISTALSVLLLRGVRLMRHPQ